MASAPVAPSPWGLYCKTLTLLMALVFVASFLIVPFQGALQHAGRHDEPLQLAERHHESVAAHVLRVVTQRLAVSVIAIGLGLFLGPKVGLGAPLIRGWLAGEKAVGKRLLEILPPSLVVGVAGGLALVLALPRLGEWLTPELARDASPMGRAVAEIAPWKTALAAVSAGVIEELVFRLGLLTTLAWVGRWLTRAPQPGPLILWTANVLASLAFALAHLPNVQVLEFSITPGVVLVVLAGNGFAGLFFGWLYWRFGVESAMLAHIVLDLVVKVLGPFIIPSGGAT